jgi:hypothetical protein
MLPERFNHGRIFAITTLHRFLPAFQCEMARREGFPLDALQGIMVNFSRVIGGVLSSCLNWINREEH